MSDSDGDTYIAISEDHHATISLFQSMYPLESELELSPDTADFMANGLNLSSSSKSILPLLSFTIGLKVNDDPELPLSLYITLDFPTTTTSTTIDRQSLCSVTLRQPPYLSRAEHSAISALISPFPLLSMDVIKRFQPGDSGVGEYILETIDIVQSGVSDLLAERAKEVESREREGRLMDENEQDEGLERVWFWFPSLSSKEKRRDLVEFGHEAGLTGFVLAGKPGLLCVEGPSRTIDHYMARIKSESWRDIPPGHKKVSERMRIGLVTGSGVAAAAGAVEAEGAVNGNERKGEDKFKSASASESHVESESASVNVNGNGSNTRRGTRSLPPLVDISDLIPRYGTYAHRAEMGQVRKIVDAWSGVVGEEMGRVLMA